MANLLLASFGSFFALCFGAVRFELPGLTIGAYRLFLVVVCGIIAATLQVFLVGTRFGAQLRAAVDDRRVAAGLGIDVGRLFAVAFAIGSGLAGLGGALYAALVRRVSPDREFSARWAGHPPAARRFARR